MEPNSSSAARRGASSPGWWLGTLGLLAGVLGVMFAESFSPDRIHFASDGPLGMSAAEYFRLPGTFQGIWQDLNWVGGWIGNASPNLTNLWLWLLGPLGFSKFYPPLSLLVLGVAVGFCFRRWGFPPWVGLLGAVAAALNTDFFSYACWGLGTLPLSVAWIFVALAALGIEGKPGGWLGAGVAGLGVGLSIMEGFDSGAIFSIYVGAYVLFQAIGSGWRQWGAWVRGGARLGVVAVGAGVVATTTLGMLISTQVKGVAGMGQDVQTKAQRWDEATAWSLPKLETLRVVVPGLFGYRMDTPDGGSYWGRVGERPGVWPRHSGSGVYGGVLVVLVAVFGLLQAFRQRDGPLTPAERRAVRFWGVAALVSLLLAWGKYAPFYQVVYALPYFSTVRNPIKFMHPFHLSLVVLFGFGLMALGRLYFERTVALPGALAATVKRWWAAARGFDRRWTIGLGAAATAAVLGWLMYLASRAELEAHLKVAVSPEQAPTIAAFSRGELGWSVLFLGAGAGWMVLAMSGAFGVVGRGRARWGLGLLGAVIVLDLMRANGPWVFYWSFSDRYASNPVIELMRTRPYEGRIQAMPLNLGPQFDMLRQLYHENWLQNSFPYFNLQSLDVIQDPRPAIENSIYRAAFLAHRESGWIRQWQLTNTRYLLGLAGLADMLNQYWDPAQKRFRELLPFTLARAKPGAAILVQTNNAGPFAVIEFTGALPRGKLYYRWQVSTNDDETLQTLTNPQFDPAQTVVVSDGMPPGTFALAPTNAPPGVVDLVDYAPKRIRLKTRADAAAVLLWNDKYDPQWTVTVDGQAQPVLRCNYLMRGVRVPPGEHDIEFRFAVSGTGLAVSLAALTVGLALAVRLFARGSSG